MPSKPRNARVVLLEQVRTIKRRLDWLRNVWTVESTVFETFTDTRLVPCADISKATGTVYPPATLHGLAQMEQQFTNSRKRPREAREYPESDTDLIVQAWSQLNTIAREAAEARDALRKHYESLRPGYTIGTRDEE